MKTNLSIIFFVVIIVVLTACSSSDTEMFTKINPDGSCYREITVPYDSAYLAGDTTKNPFNVKPDSTWNLVFANKNGLENQIERYTKGKIYVVDTALNKKITLRKNYPKVQDLETFRLNDSDWDTLAIKISFTKKFRWFYTYYEFSETYPKINPFKVIPIDNYLTQEEIATIYGENTALLEGKNGLEKRDFLNDLEKKGNAWLSRNYYEEVFRTTLKYYKFFKGLPVDSATFANAKEPIYKLNKDSANAEMKFEELFDKYFKTKAFTEMDNPKELDETMKKEIPEIADYFGMELTYNLSMPGKIIDSNTPVIHGDTLTWKVDAYRFFFTDYTLHTKSRKPNIWAFGLTGLLILLITGSFWIKKK